MDDELIAWLEQVLDDAGPSARVNAERNALRLAKSVTAMSYELSEPGDPAGGSVAERIRTEAEETVGAIAETYRDEPGWREEWAPVTADG
jgi:hypothetical protein